MPDYLVIVWPHQIRRVIDELNAKGNPVGLFDKATGEIREYWPLQNVESVDDYWLTLPFRAAMSTIEKSIEPLPEEPTDRVVSLLVDDVQALDAAWGFLQSSQTPLADFGQTLTPFEVHF
ncbi:MAG: hypothetical protein LH609_03135 [Rudanella sp.]|nr:hypothetical protein [Rudanella sp.]